MCHALLSDSRLWSFLLQVDGDLAGKTREGGCPFCGAPLHKADYPRKPRGAGDPMTTAAAVDRVVHHSVILELNLRSYRAEEALLKKSQRPSEASREKDAQ